MHRRGCLCCLGLGGGCWCGMCILSETGEGEGWLDGLWIGGWDVHFCRIMLVWVGLARWSCCALCLGL